MTDEERDVIARFVARVGGAAPQTGGFAAVPQTAPALPPVDPDADRYIAEQFAAHPEARYRITQMAFAQEAALVASTNRMRQLEAQLQQAQAAAQSPRRGLFGGLFGGGQAQPPGAGMGAPSMGNPGMGNPGMGAPGGYAPSYGSQPMPYPPGYQPGMFQRQGSGFLGSALTTAAGVAGGVMLGDALMGLFSGREGGMGGFGGGGFGGAGETVNDTTINNFGDPAGGGGDPWAGAGGTLDAGGDPWANQGGGDPGIGQGGWDQGGADPGGLDQGGFDQGGFDQGGFDDPNNSGF